MKIRKFIYRFTMLTWCRIYLLVFFFMNFGICTCFSGHNFKTDLTLSKVPIRSDLNTFLYVLKKVAKYFRKNLNIIDLNVCFGIFLANVNLKHALANKRRLITFAPQVHEIIDLNAALIKYFHSEVENGNSTLNKEQRDILKLFSNDTDWINNIDNFNKVTLKSRFTEDVRYILSDLNKYLAETKSVDNHVPDPVKSDNCLALLAWSFKSYDNRCEIDESCREVLENGTNFGYSLTHRLLFLIMARYSRGCTIFTNSEDNYITNRFCSMLYVEAEFIANQAFNDGLVDLMLEIICLCGLHGHIQFLDRHWLHQIIRFQTPYGCFGVGLKKAEYTALKRKLYASRDYDRQEGLCNGHTTTLALATYAIVVRYILETYY